jgi:ubiquinone/menaquinone biosynthesis C-methylase UbiE
MHRSWWIRLIRLAFWSLYNPFAWTYDWVSRFVSGGRWHDWQRTALAELRGSEVLELGFGTGNVLLDLRAASYRPIGLDRSPSMARIAQHKLRSQHVNVPLVQGCAQQLPFAAFSFDAVLCTFPAEFIVHPDTLREIARVLRPGGRMVVVILARLLARDPWSRFLEWLYRITGQRAEIPDLTEPMSALGFKYRTVWKRIAHDAVLLAIVELDG